MSPAHKRHLAEDWVREGKYAVGVVCRHLGLGRSSFYYRAKELNAYARGLRQAVWAKSLEHAELGAKKVARLLRGDGWDIGKTRCATIRRELGLRIPPKPPKKVRRGKSTGLPTTATHRGHVWSWDFIHDRTVRGGSLKILSVIDEYTRECHRFQVERRMKASDVKRLMNQLVAEHGAPGFIRSDNGPEFIETQLKKWLAGAKVKTIYIEPGCPWENPFVESLHSQFRRECLNREQLWSLSEARVVIENWRWKYNTLRPHGSLKLETPWAYAHTTLPTQAGDCATA